MTHQLQIEQLACQRGGKILFKHLDLTIQSGDFVQIEGHNGMGKTSLLRILVGLAQPLEGKVRWNGVEITKQRENYHGDLLYLGHQAGIKPELSPWENLRFYQQISASQANDEMLWQALQTLGLLGLEDIPAGQLSAGQQRRIALARLWLSKVPLWVLDEPFTAIDKKGISVLTALFEQHIQQGGIVVLTSHQEVMSQYLRQVRLENYKIMA